MSEQLFRVENKLNKFLEKESLGKQAFLTKLDDNNIYNSVVLEFNDSSEKLIFIDMQDGYIEMFKYEGSIEEVDNIIKNSSSINSIDYHQIIDIDNIIKYDVEDIINRINSKNMEM